MYVADASRSLSNLILAGALAFSVVGAAPAHADGSVNTGYFGGVRPPAAPPAAPNGWPPQKITGVLHATEKILFICESEVSVDDGTWAGDRFSSSPLRNVLSARHDKNSEHNSDPKFGKGCVVFLDGHADFFSREDSFKPEHYEPKR